MPNVVVEAQGTLIPAATLLGYQAENAATNLCLQSQTFDNAGIWAKENATITANIQAAPDGTLTSDVFTDDAVNSRHRFYESVSGLAPSTAYTASIYLKRGTVPWIQINTNDGTINKWANFNLATGAVGNKQAATTAAVTILPNGWLRCSITFTTSVAATAITFEMYGILTDQNLAQPQYIGTGQTMYLWGAQVETGEMSSYIPTTTAAVVRNSDSLSYATATNLDGALATTYAETYMTAVRAGAYQYFLNIAAGSFFIQYYEPASKRLEVFNPGSLTTANGRVLGSINKSATAYGGASRSICLNGGAVATGAYSAQVFSGNITVGNGITGNETLTGSIRNVRFYSQRLTDAELITLTAP